MSIDTIRRICRAYMWVQEQLLGEALERRELERRTARKPASRKRRARR